MVAARPPELTRGLLSLEGYWASFPWPRGRRFKSGAPRQTLNSGSLFHNQHYNLAKSTS